MTLTCIIVDDEYLAIKILEDYISQTNNLMLMRTFKYPKDAIEYLQKNSVDLLFLDIQMPEIDGFSLLSKLVHPPMVIFTTARPDFAVKAYELDVLDYLLKPISVARFNKSVEKAIEYANYISANEKTALNRPDYLMINSDFQVHKIKFKEIIFIEGLSEYVKIHCLSGTTYITLASLRNLESQFEGFLFYRVHKSFIVNKEYIKSFSHSEIQLVNNKKIPIGRIYKKNIMALLGK